MAGREQRLEFAMKGRIDGSRIEPGIDLSVFSAEIARVYEVMGEGAELTLTIGVVGRVANCDDPITVCAVLDEARGTLGELCEEPVTSSFNSRSVRARKEVA